MTENYLITIARPKNVSVTEMRQYIAAAIDGWRGEFEPPGVSSERSPGHPLHYLNVEKLIVSVKRER